MSERLTVNNKKKGQKKHGFLARMNSKGGRKVLRRRRFTGRKVLSK